MIKTRGVVVIIVLLAFTLIFDRAEASGNGNYYNGNDSRYYDDSNNSSGRSNDIGNYYFGSSLPGPDVFEDFQNPIPWFNPPYEPYQYKFHAFPNGDFFFATPGNNYLPYISSGRQIQPFDYGAFIDGYYR